MSSCFVEYSCTDRIYTYSYHIADTVLQITHEDRYMII